jgi:tetratricopeptide (TPR) repeat protein
MQPSSHLCGNGRWDHLGAGLRRCTLCRQGMSRLDVLVVFAAIALVVVPVVLAEWPREIARWQLAAARELALQNQPAAAVSRMDRALAWNHQDAGLLLQRARYKLMTRQWQSALEDCDRARELAPNNPLVGTLRSTVLMYLGRYDEAVAEMRELVQATAKGQLFERAERLNGLAYAAAVGNVDLEEAVAAADEAWRIGRNLPAALDPAGVLHFGRAVTAQAQGDDALALSSVTEARDQAEAILGSLVKQAETLAKADPEQLPVMTDETEAIREHLAGILQLRISICQKLGQAEDAARDEQRIKTLTVDGNLAAVEPYNLFTAAMRVQECAGLLDTRGYLLYRLKKYDLARRDLDLAAQAQQRILEAEPWLIDLNKHNVVDIRPLLQGLDERKRTLAVILYHRSLVWQALGKHEEVKRDQQRVHDLGYEPNEQLF